MKLFKVLIMVLAAIPMNMNAQGYAQLWKQVTTAQQKDLPQTQLEVLQRIEDKARQERSYGNLLKARLMHVQVQSEVSPDSLRPQLERLKRSEVEARNIDPVLAAVYETVLGRIYRENVLSEEDSESKAGEYYKRALEKSDLLVKTRDSAMDPLVLTGADSRIFMHDLLHIVGFEAEEYGLLHDIYKARGNRSATCITAFFNARKQRRDFSHEVRKSKYVQTLDSLIAEYGDLVEAGELAIARYQEMENAEDVTPEDRYNYVNYALSHWGAWPRMNILRNAQTRLTLPSFHVMLGSQMQIPNKPRLVDVLGVTNVGQLTMNVQRLTIDGDTNLNPAATEDYAKLKKLVDTSFAPLSQTRRYFGLPDYTSSRDTLELPALPVGVYLVEFTTNNNSIKPERSLLYVSDLMVIHQTLAEKSVRLVAVNATTGQPVPNCKIRLTTRRYNEDDIVETIETDKHGEAVYHYKNRQPDMVYAYTDRDKASCETRFSGHFSYYDNDQSYSSAQLFTDRSIYRPGQTVHVSVVTYKNKRHEDLVAEPNKPLKLTLRDANGKVVREQELTTDAFGTASTDFQLPSSGLTGRFTIRTDYGNRAMTYFSVEEYKRPTYDVTFEAFNDSYAAGDTVMLKGTAKSYSGVPVENAQVVYTVTRRPSFWWWFRSNRDAEKVMKTDTIRTDAEGHFQVPVQMEMPDNYDSRRPRYYTFSVEAVVTDMAGESHSGQTSLPLSDKPTVLTCDLPEQELRDSLTHVQFNYMNNAGKPIPGEVRFTINGGKEFIGKANEPVKLPSFSHSGRYTFKAVCGADTLEQSVVLFAMTDKRPVVETHDWFYASANEFPRDDKPVYVQVGSSDKDQHVVYTILSGKNVVESGVIDQSNAITTRQFKYDEDYGNGLLLTYAWVKEGQLYTHSAHIRKPLPEKKLDVQWSTFRDRLTPGQKEEWTLTVKHPDGKAAEAQLMAVMYDKSLDQIKQHGWSFAPNLYVNLPSTEWNGPADYTIGLYGEQPMKPLAEKGLEWSQIDLSLIPHAVYPFLYDTVGMKRVMVRGRGLAANKTVALAAAAPQEMAVGSYEMATADAAEEMHREAEVVTEETEMPVTETAEASVRENLNETAFFYPALQADADGNVKISFTLPESITTWRMIGFAHDKEMNFGHISGEAVAQKTVMVQPNVPRFLRTGDKASIAARLFNTSDANVTGVARLQLIDPQTDKVIVEQKRSFSIQANGSSAVTFGNISVVQSNVLICKVTASGNGYSDGEQHYLPVLPDKQLITNTLPFTQNEPGTKTVDLKKLFPVSDPANKLTVEYTNNPAWLMIQTLPTVSSPCDKNAISLATAFYANSIASNILNQSRDIRKTIELWKQETGSETSLMSSLQKNEELKTLVLNETPWVFDADREADQKAQLINYFDQSALDYRLSQQLEQLRALQNADGSFSWWPGMNGSLYMTTSVVETLVRLNTLIGNQSQTAATISNGLEFLTKQMHDEVVELKKLEKKGEKGLRPSEMAVNYLYIRALRDDRLTGQAKEDEAYLVGLLEKKTTELSIYGKARSAIILAHNKRDAKAGEYLQSIREYTVYKEEMGRYFDTPRALYSWRDYRIPSQVAAIEALKALAPQDKAISEMQRWLLQEKRTQAWDTPVNTVDAVHAFLGGQEDVLKLSSASEQTQLKVNGKPLSLPQATAGLGYVKTATSGSNMNTFTAEKTSEGTSWGAVYAQFMQPVTEVADASAGLTVRRDILTANGIVLSQPLSVGDRVKVRLTITADRDYDFVQVVDQRAACMEPVGQLSGYHWGYYTTPRDNATNYYFDCLGKGTHVIETEYYIDREGTYETGLCTVQCAYSPEYSARAAAQVINVGK